MAQQYKATLIRGRTYYLREKRFEFGKPLIISESDMIYLEENAVDITVTKDKERIVRDKFKFEEYDPADDVEEEAEVEEKPKAKETTQRAKGTKSRSR